MNKRKADRSPRSLLVGAYCRVYEVEYGYDPPIPFYRRLTDTAIVGVYDREMCADVCCATFE